MIETEFFWKNSVSETIMNTLDTKLLTTRKIVTTKKVEQFSKTKTKSKEGLKKVTREFESVFLEQLFKTMRKTIPKSGFLDGGQSEEIYTYMLDQELSKKLSQRGIGIADMLYKQLSKL